MYNSINVLFRPIQMPKVIFTCVKLMLTKNRETKTLDFKSDYDRKILLIIYKQN